MAVTFRHLSDMVHEIFLKSAGKKQVYPSLELFTRPDPTNEIAYPTRPIPASTGWVRVYPRVGYVPAKP